MHCFWFLVGLREYHVQFFGSVPERAWVNEKRTVVYQGESQFDELQAETLRKTTNPTERQKVSVTQRNVKSTNLVLVFPNAYFVCVLQLLKPQSQKERAQWEVGVGHAEAALLMTREERNENYTFIYIDKEPGAAAAAATAAAAAATDTVTSPRATGKTRPERKQRRSRGSTGAKEVAIPRRQQPRRQCSIASLEEPSSPSEEQDEEHGDKQQPDSPPEPDPPEPSPPPVRTPWRTAAARKLLPLSITMKKLNVEIIKCDWQIPKQNLDIPKKVESEERPGEQVQSPEVTHLI